MLRALLLIVLLASRANSLPVFITGFVILFIFSGIGNGSVYKMIPAIFHAESLQGGSRTNSQDRRLASALVGIAGAIGAFGGVLVQVAFRESFLTYGNGSAAYLAW